MIVWYWLIDIVWSSTFPCCLFSWVAVCQPLIKCCMIWFLIWSRRSAPAECRHVGPWCRPTVIWPPCSAALTRSRTTTSDRHHDSTPRPASALRRPVAWPLSKWRYIDVVLIDVNTSCWKKLGLKRFWGFRFLKVFKSFFVVFKVFKVFFVCTPNTKVRPKSKWSI